MLPSFISKKKMFQNKETQSFFFFILKTLNLKSITAVYGKVKAWTLLKTKRLLKLV